MPKVMMMMMMMMMSTMQYTVFYFIIAENVIFIYRYLTLQLKVQFENHLNRVKINVILMTDGFCNVFLILGRIVERRKRISFIKM
jgi:hypothetical protein